MVGFVALLNAVIACGGLGPDPVRAPLAETTSGGHRIQLTCTAPEVRYPNNPFPSGCTWQVAVGADDELPLVLSRGPHGADCAEARAACDAMTGELAVRADGTTLRIAAIHRGAATGAFTQYLVDPGARWLIGGSGDASLDAPTQVDAMPTLREALGLQLASVRDGAPTERREDALWSIVADPLVARDHVAVLAELATTCRLDEPVARALLAADPGAVTSVYRGARKTSCHAQSAALRAAPPEGVQPLIAADLAARTGLPDADDVTLAGLAADLGLKELTAPIAARLLLAEAPGPLDANDPSLAAFVQLAGVLERLDPEAPIAASLAALAWAPGPAYTTCEIPDDHATATYSGYPPGFALAVAGGLRAHDSPATRGALFAIAADATRSGAARQVARFLLAERKDARADQLADVVFNPCQAERLAQSR